MPSMISPSCVRSFPRFLHAGVSLLLLPLAANGQPVANPVVRNVRLVVTVDDGERSGGSYLLASIASVVATPAGDLFVLDRTESDIKVFNRQGRYLRTVARRGSGPGELSGPPFTMLRTDSAIVVTDIMLRRNVYFGFDGKHLRTLSHARETSGNQLSAPQTTLPMRKGWALRISPPQSVDFNPDPFSHVMVHSSVQARTDTLARIRSDILIIDRNNGKKIRRDIASTRVGDGGAWAAYADSLVVLVDGYEGTVRWVDFETGVPRMRRTERLAGVSVPTTMKDFEGAKDAALRAWRKINPQTEITVVEMPPRHTLADRALFSDDASLWVGAPPKGDSSTWTVFPRSGPSFAVVLPAQFHLTYIQGNRLYGHGVGPDDTPQVFVYELDVRQ